MYKTISITGGFQSALETVEDFKHYMLHVTLSLNEFLDDNAGGEFLFATCDLSLKIKLHRDYAGRAMNAEKKT